MIKALTQRGVTKSGRSLLFLGIEDVNIERLRAGKPIKIDGTEIGIECDILIFHGTTSADLIDILRSFGANVPSIDPSQPTVMRSVQEGGPLQKVGKS
jgi:hypothetical protein